MYFAKYKIHGQRVDTLQPNLVVTMFAIISLKQCVLTRTNLRIKHSKLTITMRILYIHTTYLSIEKSDMQLNNLYQLCYCVFLAQKTAFNATVSCLSCYRGYISTGSKLSSLVYV